MSAECKLFIQTLLSFLGPGNTFRGMPSTTVIQEKKGVVPYTQLMLSNIFVKWNYPLVTFQFYFLRG